MHIDDDEFIELARKKKLLQGYVIFKRCRVTYDINKDEFIADETDSLLTKILWWIVDNLCIFWNGNVILLDEEDEDNEYK